MFVNNFFLIVPAETPILASTAKIGQYNSVFFPVCFGEVLVSI